jgi:hypothetical protein
MHLWKWIGIGDNGKPEAFPYDGDGDIASTGNGMASIPLHMGANSITNMENETARVPLRKKWRRGGCLYLGKIESRGIPLRSMGGWNGKHYPTVNGDGDSVFATLFL